jgi:hypothetical protein
MNRAGDQLFAGSRFSGEEYVHITGRDPAHSAYNPAHWCTAGHHIIKLSLLGLKDCSAEERFLQVMEFACMPDHEGQVEAGFGITNEIIDASFEEPAAELFNVVTSHQSDDGRREVKMTHHCRYLLPCVADVQLARACVAGDIEQNDVAGTIHRRQRQLSDGSNQVAAPENL